MVVKTSFCDICRRPSDDKLIKCRNCGAYACSRDCYEAHFCEDDYGR